MRNMWIQKPSMPNFKHNDTQDKYLFVPSTKKPTQSKKRQTVDNLIQSMNMKESAEEHNNNMRWGRQNHNKVLTAICLLCLSIHCISWPLIRVTASYHSVSAGSTPDGGHWLFPPSARGARMFESMLQRAWWSSLFRLCGALIRGLAFATNEADAFNPPSVLTWKPPFHNLGEGHIT